MEGKDAIINKIIGDANDKASEIISTANKKAEDIICDAQNWADEYTKTQNKVLEEDIKDIISRKVTVASLDVKKIVLSIKQDAISKVLYLAYKKLCELDKKSYLTLVEKMIIESADEGDQILLSCDGVLSKQDLEGLKVYKDKKLSISVDRGSHVGGVYLIGKVCDKDLTFKALISGQRDNFVTEISNELFGNN